MGPWFYMPGVNQYIPMLPELLSMNTLLSLNHSNIRVKYLLTQSLSTYLRYQPSHSAANRLHPATLCKKEQSGDVYYAQDLGQGPELLSPHVISAWTSF